MQRVALTQSNFIYRHPRTAELLRRPSAAARAQRWMDLIDRHHPNANTVIDLGCWIGLDAEHLAARYDVLGIDVQPHLIDYARRYRRRAGFQVGDFTSIRLDRSFDAFVCVGNSLAYVHKSMDLDAAFTTFSAHAHRGSLLIVETLLAPIDDAPAQPERVEAGNLRATVTDHDHWHALTQMLTTHRTWRYDDGTTETDILYRRVLPAPELELRAHLAGWDVLSVEFDPPSWRAPPWVPWDVSLPDFAVIETLCPNQLWLSPSDRRQRSKHQDVDLWAGHGSRVTNHRRDVAIADQADVELGQQIDYA